MKLSFAFALTIAVAAPASATVFNFTSGGLVKMLDGITVTTTAWSTTGSGGVIQTANAMIFSGAGLGVCNQLEAGCGSPEHQIDNATAGVDFVLMTFGSNVTLNSAVLKSFGPTAADRDVTYFTGNFVNPSSINLAGLTLSSLPAGFSAAINSDTASSLNPRTLSFGAIGPVNALLIGARAGAGADANPDYFKLQSLDVSGSGSGVPEPSTYMLIGSALMFLGLYRRQIAR